MRTIVERQGERITFDGGGFECQNEITRRILFVIANDVRSMTAYTPDADYESALRFTKRYGGEIVEYDGPGTEGDGPETVY